MMDVSKKYWPLTLIVSLTLSASGAFFAQHADAAERRGVVRLSPGERGELARRFVLKWGDYAQKVYGVKVDVWAMRLVPNFVAARPEHFHRALQRETFEGAMAELNGTGGRLSDSKVIDLLARAPAGTAIPAKALGDAATDLVYTPLTPCRIVDTRNAQDGAIAAQGERAFYAFARPNYSDQGGAANDCGAIELDKAAAIAINVTAVLPDGAGYATVYQYSPTATRPLASSVNYVAGAIVNNTVITSVGTVGAPSFIIYSFARSHYVVDIVGVFKPPSETGFSCKVLIETQTVAAGANFDFGAPECSTLSAARFLTAAGCDSAGFNQVNWAATGVRRADARALPRCAGTNVTAGEITVTSYANCCSIAAPVN
jgi:hypothetical protein